jgi:hypothetical protein
LITVRGEHVVFSKQAAAAVGRSASVDDVTCACDHIDVGSRGPAQGGLDPLMLGVDVPDYDTALHPCLLVQPNVIIAASKGGRAQGGDEHIVLTLLLVTTRPPDGLLVR